MREKKSFSSVHSSSIRFSPLWDNSFYYPTRRSNELSWAHWAPRGPAGEEKKEERSSQAPRGIHGVTITTGH